MTMPDSHLVELDAPETARVELPLQEEQDLTPLPEQTPESVERERITTELRAIVTKVVDNNYESGTKGLLEHAITLLTTPLVKASGYVTFPGCSDCQQEDAAIRTTTYIIPFGVKLPVCGDCTQKTTRVFPQYICNLCPVDARLREATELLLTILVGMGVKPQFDKDGCYTPPKGKTEPLPEQARIDMIMNSIMPTERHDTTDNSAI